MLKRGQQGKCIVFPYFDVDSAEDFEPKYKSK